MSYLPKRSLLKVLLFLIILIGLIFLLNLSFFSKLKSPEFNLVIISIDTLRPDHMGVYGYNKDTTPNIDTWAKNANVFTNVRTIVPMTMPSFAALMTGKNPLDTRIVTNQGWLLSDNSTTLASVLRSKGYRVASFTTGALNPKITNINKGVEETEFLVFKRYFFKEQNEYYYQSDRGEYETFLGKSQDFLSKNKDSKFFLWVHLMDPHAPYQPPNDLKCKFNQKYCDYINSNSQEELEEERADYQFCQNESIPQDKLELFETLYDGGVAYSDKLVGQILNQIKKLNLEKNTIVLLYGDHGEGFDHNYFFNHRDVLYDSALKIPLIIKTPDTNSKKSDLAIDNTDILPTLLDLLGIKYQDPNIYGKSFSSEFGLNPIRFGNIVSSGQKKLFFSNHTLTKFAVLDGDYKYIYSLDDSCLLNGQNDELYNLKDDPKELNNLFESKPKIAQKLKDELFKYLSKYNLPPKFRTRNNQNTPAKIELQNEVRQFLPY